MRFSKIIIKFLLLLFTALTLQASFIIAEEYYWEAPQTISPTTGHFPVSDTNQFGSVVIWQEPVTKSDKDGTLGELYLSGAFASKATGEWDYHYKFSKPIHYGGDEPALSSVIIDDKGRVLVAAPVEPDKFQVLITSDWGETFTTVDIPGSGLGLVAPRISSRSDGGYFLFASKGEDDTLSIYFSRSDDGEKWTPFTKFKPVEDLGLSFLPTHRSYNGVDVVVFQSLYTARISTFQLYSTISKDGGRSWSQPYLISAFKDPVASYSERSFDAFDNQRPYLGLSGNKLYLAWERSLVNGNAGIYFSPIDETGKISGLVEKISTGTGICNDPYILEYQNSPSVVWYDNRRGANRVYLGRQDGIYWSNTDLSGGGREAFFARPVVINDDLHIFWQQDASGDKARIVRLSPDRTVLSPILQAVNFVPSVGLRSSLAQIQIRLPADSSGLVGYSYVWTQNKYEVPPKEIMGFPEQTSLRLPANEDGSWYLGVRAADEAGNWSETSYIEFVRDTTGPGRPLIKPPFIDGGGYSESNSPSLQWLSPDDPDIAGYTYSFEFMAPLSYLSLLAKMPESSYTTGSFFPSSLHAADFAEKYLRPSLPPRRIMTKDKSISITNRDNGIYAFSVSAIDRAGNIGEPEVMFLFLNKYIPYTYITSLNAKQDASGVLNLSIIGKGFSQNGKIHSIHLDSDGIEPWDYTLKLSDGDYLVENDRFITDISLSDLSEGTYYVVLEHPVRGRYFSTITMTVSEFGTVKFGDYTYRYVPSWNVPENDGNAISVGTLAFGLLLLFVMFGLFMAGKGLYQAATETTVIKLEIQALIGGDVMPSEKKKIIKKIQKGHVSLKFKFTFFTAFLVMMVVLLVSIPLSRSMILTQEQTLSEGLESRTKVLLESLASGAKAYLPSQNLLELSFLPAQSEALDEAISATITGFSSNANSTNIDFVWATNDNTILTKIDTETLAPGNSRIIDDMTSVLENVQEELNVQALKEVGELSKGIAELTAEGLRLVSMSTTFDTVQRLSEIQTVSRQLEEELNSKLNELSVAGIGSYPTYDSKKLDRNNTRYTFFKPVLFRQGTDDVFVRGFVRIEISTETLITEVDSAVKQLVLVTVLVALLAISIGIVGALILSSIIVSPIKKLAAHVEMIRDTEDKEALDGKDIEIKSKDEIGVLGDTINAMTHGLVKAAAASKDLTVGKEVQKMFIPLETDSMGKKLTTGSRIDETVSFFGYYEGAKGVSGDYFDYIKLDDRFYSMIKCDIAGKGVPAALIMVEVATLFLNYFKDWSFKKNGFRLNELVSKINDMIESRGFKGRFAAFTLCLYDSVAGDLYFCNAGDNLVHIFDKAQKTVRLITLPEVSAAGVFPSFMIDTKGGFPVVKQHLNHGDIVFLYTDGIEEAKRCFRDSNLNIITCQEPGLPPEAPHETHSVGQDNEELGQDRVHAIIDSVMNRQVYKLEKWHNPIANEVFDFDFSVCNGTVEEAIMALVSVEKIFRMYKDGKATEFDRVQVDRKVDSFLKKTFLQYSDYCGFRKDHAEFKEYMYYTNIKEDAQYDDLTILGIERK